MSPSDSAATAAITPLPGVATASARTPAYRRILLKLSGEALMGSDSYGIERETIDRIVAEVAEVVRLGVQVAIVIGGGNIFRGVAPGAAGMDRATADYMGMLATLMNALALQDALRRAGVESRVQSALRIDQVAEPYIRGRALRHLEEHGGHLRRGHRQSVLHHRYRGSASRPRDGCRHRAEGNQGRRRLHVRPAEGHGRQALFDAHLRRGDRQEPAVMDATALALCRDQNMLLKVFSIFVPGALKRVVMGEDEGTLVHC